MKKTEQNYQHYVGILKEELIPAGGCTEPVAIAYVAATARKVLGVMPERMDVFASGNLIKNAMGVYIPNGGNLRGVGAAAVLGVVGGNADRKLEVLLDMPTGKVIEARKLLEQNFCAVSVLEHSEALHLIVRVQAGADWVEVELKNAHTHIVRIEKNGAVVFCCDDEEMVRDGLTDHKCLNIAQIVDFADTCDIGDVEEVLDRQISCNLRIAEEGLKNDWGVNVGKLYYRNGKLLQAYAASASDARMGGCDLPVVIVCGSGNQGATASLPVILYAREKGLSHERLLRALVLSNLIVIHLKRGIGRLSAYCGVVCAATGSGCALTYLDGGTLHQIEQTITNSLGTASGVICDGAKPSCAAKIALCLESAIMAHQLAMEGQAFQSGEGIVMDSVEKTIDAVGCMASKGMYATDCVILNLMTKEKE
ncbi:L-cysteine desulfidase family protein [Parasphaerochaeta coccoides]|uniref:UPF0597 protein Spico_0113 n=1 Tax=Parasphaerochaeta coccoides (strain ATCC BAA-1237 / DSM 17374 / SPN1) TaxID=760011 RepID=F4GJT0_PARC1|nr:L-serine ammonia-lyase, iron-sulfur-dependent, subunit alpha [Parasphaerochaeta coccoides]AEC01355.1 UPF0597 protein yhaM [Parasphaerochaeta coccoides DSM 17374]